MHVSAVCIDTWPETGLQVKHSCDARIAVPDIHGAVTVRPAGRPTSACLVNIVMHACASIAQQLVNASPPAGSRATRTEHLTNRACESQGEHLSFMGFSELARIYVQQYCI